MALTMGDDRNGEFSSSSRVKIRGRDHLATHYTANDHSSKQIFLVPQKDLTFQSFYPVKKSMPF